MLSRYPLNPNCKGRGGQVAVEFIFVAGIAFFMLVLIVAVTAHEVNVLRGEREFLLVKDLAYNIRTEIITAIEVQDGYSRSFTLPAQIDGTTYTATFGNKSIIVQTPKYEFSLKTPEVKGALQQGQNSIRKQGGVVYIN